VAGCLILAQIVPTFSRFDNLPCYSGGKLGQFWGEGVAGLKQALVNKKAAQAGGPRYCVL